MSREPSLTVEVLVEALPYIREFRGSTIVVKFGGNAMVDRALVQTFADDIVLLHSLGIDRHRTPRANPESHRGDEFLEAIVGRDAAFDHAGLQRTLEGFGRPEV